MDHEPQEPDMSLEDRIVFLSETCPRLPDYTDIPSWWIAVMDWSIDLGLAVKRWEEAQKQSDSSDSPG